MVMTSDQVDSLGSGHATSAPHGCEGCKLSHIVLRKAQLVHVAVTVYSEKSLINFKNLAFLFHKKTEFYLFWGPINVV